MANESTPNTNQDDLEGQYAEGDYGDAGASPEALKDDAGGDYTAGDYSEKTVPSADAELDDKNTEDVPEDRPFSSEPGDEAAGTGNP